MKTRLILLLILAMLVSVTLMGCSSKDDSGEKNESPVEKQEETKAQETQPQNDKKEEESEAEDDQGFKLVEVSNDIKEQAKKEGVTVEELQAALDGLTEIGARDYGITVEEMIARSETDGNTILSEWQQFSEQVGMGIVEVYEMEKARGDSLTGEQKEMLNAQSDFLDMTIKLDELKEAGKITEDEYGQMLQDILQGKEVVFPE